MPKPLADLETRKKSKSLVDLETRKTPKTMPKEARVTDLANRADSDLQGTPFQHVSLTGPKKMNMPAHASAQASQYLASLDDYADSLGDDDIGATEPELPETSTLPRIITQELSAARAPFEPEWYPVASLPGNAKRVIRQMGKEIFSQYTDTPVDQIFTVSTLTNSETEVKCIFALLRKKGAMIKEVSYDFEATMPGYTAEAKLWRIAGFEFLLVKDFAGHYAYGWAVKDSRLGEDKKTLLESKYFKTFSRISESRSKLKEDDFWGDYYENKAWTPSKMSPYSDTWEVFVSHAQDLANTFWPHDPEYTWVLESVDAFKPDDDGDYFLIFSDCDGKHRVHTAFYDSIKDELVYCPGLSSHKKISRVWEFIDDSYTLEESKLSSSQLKEATRRMNMGIMSRTDAANAIGLIGEDYNLFVSSSSKDIMAGIFTCSDISLTEFIQDVGYDTLGYLETKGKTALGFGTGNGLESCIVEKSTSDGFILYAVPDQFRAIEKFLEL